MALMSSRPETLINLGQSDSQQLIFAAEQQRTVITNNRRDFEALHRVTLTEQLFHAGIIVANRRSSDLELARRIMNLINLFTADEITNQLFYI